jgi:hypothetical protein
LVKTLGIFSKGFLCAVVSPVLKNQIAREKKFGRPHRDAQSSKNFPKKGYAKRTQMKTVLVPTDAG